MSWNLGMFFIELLFCTFDIFIKITTVISAFATVVLVGVTTYYARTTMAILEEQRKSRKIIYIDKKLEKLYLLKHDLRHGKIFWYVNGNSRYHLNREKIKFQFTYLFSKKLKDKLDLLIEKLDKADNEKEHKKIPWELDYVKRINNETLEIVENEIKEYESELNELVG